MTLKELAEGLMKMIEKYPEFANKEVYHSTECGFSTAGFEKPLTIAAPVASEEFQNTESYVYILSDDDGYRKDRFVVDWRFYQLND